MKKGEKKRKEFFGERKRRRKIQGRFKEISEREEKGNQSSKKVYLLTQKHLINCEFKIDVV